MTGVTVATCVDALATELLVTVAVRLPAVAGFVSNVTVSEVALAAVTVPLPSLKLTLLFRAIGSNPKPLTVIVLPLAKRLVELLVTTGFTVRTCTAAPLLTLSVVITAVRLPALIGFVPNDTVSDVVDAPVTVPTAPSLKATVLLS